MTVFVVFLAIGLTGVSPTELEIAGNLPEAGLAWQVEGDLGGQARVLCRLLEEALYAGHGNRAKILIDDLARFNIDIELVDFWYARLALPVARGVERQNPRQREGVGEGSKNRHAQPLDFGRANRKVRAFVYVRQG